MSKEGSKLARFMRAPIRALCRARDLYVSSMKGCAAHMPYESAVACPVALEPRSYSISSGRLSISAEEDLRELIRAASMGRTGSLKSGAPGGVGVPRSQSVAVGRIDEDQPCEFDRDVRVGSNLLFPRSRSCAVGRKRRVTALG